VAVDETGPKPKDEPAPAVPAAWKPTDFWQSFALAALLLATVFLLAALILSGFDHGPFAARASQDAATADATTVKSRSAVEAIGAAAVVASALKSAADAGEITAEAGQQTLRKFLEDVGVPLTKNAISAVAKTLWNRYVDPGKQASEVLPLQSPSQTIKVVVHVVGQRPVVRVIHVPPLAG
jgi:hypothetical protein